MKINDETSWLRFLDVEELQKLRRKTWTFVYWPFEEDDDVTVMRMKVRNLARVFESRVTPSLISPIHDSDIKDDGTVAKAHVHVVLFFEQPVRYKYVLQFINYALGLDTVKYVEPVHNVRAMMRYLTHMDNLEKAQYDPLDVIEVAGAKHVIEDETASEMVVQAILDNRFKTITSTLNYFNANPSARKWIVNNPGLVKTLCKEQEKHDFNI